MCIQNGLRFLNPCLARFEPALLNFQVEIFSGETLLDTAVGSRPAENSLAKAGVELLTVDGFLRVSSAIRAEASLENFVLDDSRSVQFFAGIGPLNGDRP